jgi:hypothetical protein
MSQGRKYAPPPGRGASVEAAGAVRSMCHALRIHPLGACLFSTDRNHSTPKSHGTMRGKYCCKLQHETSAAAGCCAPTTSDPTSGLAGGLRVRRGGRLRRPRGIPGLPGHPGSPADHREAHPADSGPARRGPVRVLARTRPQLIWPVIAALLRFIRLSGQLQVPNRWKRILVLAASGVRPERVAVAGRCA